MQTLRRDNVSFGQNYAQDDTKNRPHTRKHEARGELREEFLTMPGERQRRFQCKSKLSRTSPASYLLYTKGGKS